MDQIQGGLKAQVGGKAFNLARLSQHEFRIPPGICLPTGCYEAFVSEKGLEEKIFIELNRKAMADMRWEELFDASLRIRNYFLTTPLPEQLESMIRSALGRFEGYRVVVRSSSIAEDGKDASFAGIHETIVNVVGTDHIINAIKAVWASLWSDAALLYRKELSLDLTDSKMAVVIQELIVGEKSGIIFTENPMNSQEMVIEGVYGLNQGLVDNLVAPDRYQIARQTGQIVAAQTNDHSIRVVLTEGGTATETLPAALQHSPVLSPPEVQHLYRHAHQIEALFGAPQDVEWTMKSADLFILQTRPIIRQPQSRPEYPQKEWYLQLRRSFSQLQEMARKISEEIIPEMVHVAEDLDLYELTALTDEELAFEVQERAKVYQHWNKVYYDVFIPFGHGFRLFGQVYNDAVKPADSFQFLRLLQGTNLISLKRNAQLLQIADLIEQNHITTAADLQRKGHHHVKQELDAFFKEYRDSPFLSDIEEAQFVPFLLELSKTQKITMETDSISVQGLEEHYMRSFPAEKREFAQQMLDLGRMCYEMRDNDNIYLGKIHGQLFKALHEAKKRLEGREATISELVGARVEEVILALKNENYKPQFSRKPSLEKLGKSFKFRQLKGQPASRGVIEGPCWVFRGDHKELLGFQAGQILVCAAVDPNMTFILPLCGGIIEERGGMLVHGALIAREYGIPCVTGVVNATQILETGQNVTLDGHLGLVVID